MTIRSLDIARNPLCAAILGSVVAVSYAAVVSAETTVNPDAAPQALLLAAACNPCNPCAAKSPCNPCNPCAAKNPCNPCNPCAAKNPCNPCNPCAAKNPCNPCNPCAAKSPCASACSPCNPCAAGGGKSITVAGTLVDTRCFSKNRSWSGNDHGAVKGCATACAKMGIPAAVLSGDEMFVVVAPAPILAEHMAKQVRMTGTEVQSGMVVPAKLEVKTASGWKTVSTSAMM